MIQCDIAIVGAGAAGLAAAIFAGETAAHAGRPLSILLLDGAAKVGAKILVSGGGRCNVTNRKVTPGDFCGGSPKIIRNVLRAFDERRTIEWMESLGVPLKLEPEGKYFPVSNRSRTVLDALLHRARELGCEIRPATRITGIQPAAEGYRLATADDPEFLECRRLIVATGGLALPKSGSDGAGLGMLRALGHTVIPTTPALVPLILRPGPDLGGRFAEFAGITLDMRIGLYSAGGKRLVELKNSLLFTHFGLSGPAALDFSRHWLRARLENPGEKFQAMLGHPYLPTLEAADQWLRDKAAQNPRRTVAHVLAELFPERLARAYAESIPAMPGGSGETGAPGTTDTTSPPSASEMERNNANASPESTSAIRNPQSAFPSSKSAFSNSLLSQLPRPARLWLARALARLPIEIERDRGYSYAEATAGGVDLREIDPATMRSRIGGRMFVVGEALDVDGRIGGYNFQWAWATGHLAGRAAAKDLE